MALCNGSYTAAIRVHPATGAAECSECGARFDRRDLAGEAKVNVPGHSPLRTVLGGYTAPGVREFLTEHIIFVDVK